MNQGLINSSVMNPSLSVSYHIDFADFLSVQEAVTAFCTLIESTNQTLYFEDQDQEESQKMDSFVNFVDKISERILHFLHTPDGISIEEKTKLIRLFKSNLQMPIKMLNKKKNFQHLRFLLMSTTDEHNKDISLTPVQSSPIEVFEVLLHTKDELLLTRNTNLYKTHFVNKNSYDSARIHYVHAFINAMYQNHVSDFKREFIVEWIFEKSLINALVNEELIYSFISIGKEMVQNFGQDPVFMRGMIRALQKDYIDIGKSVSQKNENFETDLLEKATSLIEALFPHFVELAKKNLSYLSKQIIDFAFSLPVPKEEYRLIKWGQWRWIRMVSTNTWDASLREPPSWIISAGTAYCAIIFDCAPPIWLQDYAYLLLERVHAETLVEGFTPTIQHYDYVEFLVRCLKKKSPYFGSHNDSYLALHLLSRLTSREMHKFSFAMPNKHALETNPVSQALGVLLRMTHI